MRITFLSVSDRLGGSEVALLSMIGALSGVRPSWQFQVVLPGDGELFSRVASLGAQTVVVPMPVALARLGESAVVRRKWSAVSTGTFAARLAAAASSLPSYERDLARPLDAFAPDVVHSNGIKTHVVGARLARPGRRLVWHLHEYVSPRRVTRRLLSRYRDRCDALIANSRSVAEDARGVLGPDLPLHVVHNAVDLDAFGPEGETLDLDQLSGLPPIPAVRVGLVAAFGRWKGHETFAAAMRSVVEQATVPVRGYVVGGPLYDTAGSQHSRAEIEEILARHRVAEQVGLTGFVDAAAAMRSLDVVVHASTEREPFGLVVAEGMASARPVITTGSGGTAELVADERTALVVAPGDPRALAAAMLRLAHRPALRAALGSRAREEARERFSPSRMATALAGIYEGLLSERPA